MNHDQRVRRLEQHSPANATERPPTAADIAEFATSATFLGLALYQVQLLVLKLATGAVNLLTSDDHRRLAEWMAGFRAVDDRGTPRWQGTRGTTPDVLERAEWCQRAGRGSFRELVLVLGRRSGKTLMAAVLMVWKVWQLLELDDPQAHYCLPTRKRITLLVFSTTRETAQRDAFGDIVALVTASACFARFVESITSDSIRFYTPAQLRRGARQRGEPGSIVIVAAPTVAAVARGAAVIAVLFDEVAYLDTGNATTSTDLYRATVPAMTQFGPDAMMILASTPASQAGLFYDQYRRATSIDPVTGEAAFPDRLMLQLPSVAMYDGWQHASEHPMWPSGPNYPTFRSAIIDQGIDLAAAQRADPEGYATEFDAQWRPNRHAYFPPSTVDGLFLPFQGRRLIQLDQGVGNHRYVAHGDPALSVDNFAFMIAHSEIHDDGLTHVVIDRVNGWSPPEFTNHEIDYRIVQRDIISLVERFRIAELYFDQQNSAKLIQDLQYELSRVGYGTHVGRVQASTVSKLERYELTKRAINEGLVHCPEHQLLRDEARFIQRVDQQIKALTTGPVTTDDYIDTLTWIVYHLLGLSAGTFTALRELAISPADLDLFKKLSNVHQQRTPPPNAARGRPTRRGW